MSSKESKYVKGIVLYGLLIWKYCKRRDKEDKENGIIDENGNEIN